MTDKKLIIAVDGHSSCGKSTIAKQLADYLKYKYIDTGAMYRAVTLFAQNNNFFSGEVINEEELRKSIENNLIDIDFVLNSETNLSETYLNEINVERQIRGVEVASKVSFIAKIDFVRNFLVKQQQKMGFSGGIVMDGRDIGTVVFPQADLKIFLTARTEVRALRRYKELTEKGENVSLEEIKKNIEERDFIDTNRKESPLRKADDAILIDNSDLTREQQLKVAVELVKEKLNLK